MKTLTETPQDYSQLKNVRQFLKLIDIEKQRRSYKIDSDKKIEALL